MPELNKHVVQNKLNTLYNIFKFQKEFKIFYKKCVKAVVLGVYGHKKSKSSPEALVQPPTKYENKIIFARHKND